MKYAEMTDREQRLSRASRCPLCHTSISKFEDVQIVKIRYGRRIVPFYIHTACLLNSLYVASPSQLEREGVNYAEEG